jgi:hypothetical protein
MIFLVVLGPLLVLLAVLITAIDYVLHGEVSRLERAPVLVSLVS